MIDVAMGTRHGLAKVGDLKTLWAMSRSEARTTNLPDSDMISIYSS